MKLLIEELTPTECNIITEASRDGKSCYLSGILMQGEIENRNKRKYPVTEIARAVTEAYARIKECNGIFGELDHPQTLNINLDRISHAIKEIRMEGNNAVGRLQILDTPSGRIARTLIESGVRLGVSSRGAGNVKDDGEVEGFSFVTIDIVATPSAPGAMPQSVFESLQHARNGNRIMTLAEEVRNDPKAQKHLVNEIKTFLKNDLRKK